MFSKILNYTIRIIMISLGLAMITFGVFFSEKLNDSTLVTVMGVVVTLFGIYRLSMYRTQTNRYFNINEGDSEDEDEK